MHVAVIRCGPAVNASERRAIDRFKTGLISIPGNEEWRLLTNLRFSPNPNRQSDEIDVVAIGPPGVRVIEVKHWTSAWMKRNGDLVEHEVERVTDKAKRVAGKLRRALPELPFVEGALVSTAPRRKWTETEGRRLRGVPLHGLEAGWQATLGLGATECLTTAQIKTLAQLLWPRISLAETGELERLAGYSELRLLTPPEREFHRIYRGRHTTRHDRVQLHLFDLSADTTDDGSTSPREKFEAVRRLQLHAFAPRLLDSLQEPHGYAGELEFFTLADSDAPTLRERTPDPLWDTRARLRFGAQAAAATGKVHAAGLSHAATQDNVLVHHQVEGVDSPLLTGLEEARSRSDDGFDSDAKDLDALVSALAPLFEARDDDSSRQALKALHSRRPSPEKLAVALRRLADAEDFIREPDPVRKAREPGDEITIEGAKYRIVALLDSRSGEADFKVVQLEPRSGEESRTFLVRAIPGGDIRDGVREAGARAFAIFRQHEWSPVHQVASSSDSDFVLLMPWIEGEPLLEFVGLLREFAEDSDTDPDALAVLWLRGVLKTLDVLHRNQISHGDINLENLLLAGEELVLIGCERAGASRSTPARDVQDLANTFCQAFLEGPAIPAPEGVDADRGQGERDEYPEFARFVERVVGSDGGGGLPDAASALAFLDQSPSHEQPSRRPNEVRWLRSLLSSYPGSRWGNRETRGLDSKFAEETYVETNIEESLYDDVTNRRVRLVVLFGNAGDGKTALLQHLATRLGLGHTQSGQRLLKGATGDGLVVRMNLDGSASWDGRSADELLDEFLEPFRDGTPVEDVVHLLAVNDGRLLEWIEHVGETVLTTALEARLDDPEQPPPPHIRFVDLNDRSLVGSIPESGEELNTSFLDRLVDRLYGGYGAAETWAPCRTCSARDHCRVFETAQFFAPDHVPGRSSSERRRARDRLFTALQAVHLRGETHITVRELRSALTYILFGLHYCSDYHEGRETPAAFWDRAFNAESDGRQGEILSELARLDPALESHPRIDRVLGRGTADGGVAPRGAERLVSVRRQAYFAWSDERVEGVAGSRSALRLARGQHLIEFLDLWRPGGDLEAVKTRLCRGIARLETLPPTALDRIEHSGQVPLRITPRTPTETTFWVEKQLDRFYLEPRLPPKGTGLDRLHRQVILGYRYRESSRTEKLILGAELFHRLLDLGDGWQLGDVATDDTFAQLSIFVQRLAREDDRRLRALNPMRDGVIYEVRAVAAANSAGSQTIELTSPSVDGDPHRD